MESVTTTELRHERSSPWILALRSRIEALYNFLGVEISHHGAQLHMMMRSSHLRAISYQLVLATLCLESVERSETKDVREPWPLRDGHSADTVSLTQ